MFRFLTTNHLKDYFCVLLYLQSTTIQLSWQLSPTDIQGNEGSFNIPIRFSLDEIPNKNFENETTLSNNNVTINIPVSARSIVDVQM